MPISFLNHRLNRRWLFFCLDFVQDSKGRLIKFVHYTSRSQLIDLSLACHRIFVRKRKRIRAGKEANVLIQMTN